MNAPSTLHGRARVRRARWRRIGLLAVLLLAVAVPLVDRLSVLGTAVRYRPFTHTDAVLWSGAFHALYLGPVLAGVLIDRYGVRRVVGLGMVGWCVLALPGAIGVDAPLAYALRIPLSLVPGLVAVGVQVAIKRTLPARRSTVALAVVVLADAYARQPNYHIYLKLFAIGESWPLLLLVTCGTLVTMVWLTLVRGDERAVGALAAETVPAMIRATVGLLGRREVWVAALLLGCGVAVFELVEYNVLRWMFYDRLRDSAGEASWRMWAPFVVAPIAFLAGAAWSGRILGRTRSLAGARRPFLVGGFALCALAVVIPLAAQHDDDIVVACFVAVGLGLMSMTDLLKVDIASAGMEGRTIGLILSLALAFGLGLVQPLTRSFHAIDHPEGTAVVAALVALFAAVASHRLLDHIEPLDSPAGLRQRLDSTFE